MRMTLPAKRGLVEVQAGQSLLSLLLKAVIHRPGQLRRTGGSAGSHVPALHLRPHRGHRLPARLRVGLRRVVRRRV